MKKKGFGKTWDEVNRNSNPASAILMHKYLRAVKKEQALSHITSKQAKPIFLDKIRLISLHIEGAVKVSQKAHEVFVLLRDQAFFKVQYFAGDRAKDLGNSVSQEVKLLPDGSGFLFQHMVGKTLSNGLTNSFAIVRMDDKHVCPVFGLESYVEGALNLGIDLKCGYLFRPLDKSCKQVLNEPLSTSVVYERLKLYLNTLNIDEGETPHSFRSGCAIAFALSGAGKNVEGIMGHIGWRTKSSFERYSRIGSIAERSCVGSMLAKVSSDLDSQAGKLYNSYGDDSALKPAF